MSTCEERVKDRAETIRFRGYYGFFEMVSNPSKRQVDISGHGQMSTLAVQNVHLSGSILGQIQRLTFLYYRLWLCDTLQSKH